MLRIFTSAKNQRLRPDLNPQTWVPEASMLTTRPPKPSLGCLSQVVILLLDGNDVCFDTPRVHGGGQGLDFRDRS